MKHASWIVGINPLLFGQYPAIPHSICFNLDSVLFYFVTILVFILLYMWYFYDQSLFSHLQFGMQLIAKMNQNGHLLASVAFPNAHEILTLARIHNFRQLTKFKWSRLRSSKCFVIHFHPRFFMRYPSSLWRILLSYRSASPFKQSHFWCVLNEPALFAPLV